MSVVESLELIIMMVVVVVWIVDAMRVEVLSCSVNTGQDLLARRELLVSASSSVCETIWKQCSR